MSKTEPKPQLKRASRRCRDGEAETYAVTDLCFVARLGRRARP